MFLAASDSPVRSIEVDVLVCVAAPVGDFLRCRARRAGIEAKRAAGVGQKDFVPVDLHIRSTSQL